MSDFDKIIKNKRIALSKRKWITYYWFTIFLLASALICVITGFDRSLSDEIHNQNKIVLAILLVTSFLSFFIQRRDLKLREIETSNSVKANFKSIRVLIKKNNWEECIKDQYHFTAKTSDMYFLQWDEKIFFVLDKNRIYYTCIANLDYRVVFPLLSIMRNRKIRRMIRKELF